MTQKRRSRVFARCRGLLDLLWRNPAKALVVVLALCVTTLGASGTGLHYYAEYHLRAADQAVERYDFDDAEEHLAACLWVRPRDASLHLQMARVERRAGRFEQAAAHLEQCQNLEEMNEEN